MFRSLDRHGRRRDAACLAALIAMTMACPMTVPARLAAQQQTVQFEELAVRHLSPEEAKAQVTRIMGNAVEIIADTDGQRLLVRGPAESIQISRNVLASVDKPIAGGAFQPAPVANPAPVAVTRKTLTYSVPATQQQATYRFVQSLYPANANVSVEVDTARSELKIQAPENMLGEVREVMESRGYRVAQPNQFRTGQLGQTTSTDPTNDAYQLRHMNYRELESVLVATWGKELTVQSLMQGKRVVVQLPIPGMEQSPASMTIDRTGNQIILEGQQEYVAAWKRAVMTIDQPARQPLESSAWLKLKKLDVSGLRQAVSYLRLSGTAGDEATGILAGDRSPVLGGSPAGVPARTVAARTQEPGLAGPPQEGEFAEEVEDIPADEQPLGPIELEFIEELGIVIVKGDPEDVKRVRKLIEEIEDIANQTQPEVKLIGLDSVDSTAIATIVQELYDNIYQARQGAVTITALGKPNAVLLVGRKEAVEFVEGLIKELDVEATEDAEFKVFRLKYMSSEDMKNRINEFYLGVTQQGGFGGGIEQGNRPGLGTRVRVISDYRSNAIVVQASPSDLKEIGRLVEELDVVDPETGAENEVKIFRLKNALAEELQPVLQDALNGQLEGQGIGANPNGTTLQNNVGGFGQQQLARMRSAMLALRITNEDGEIIRGGIMYDVRVTADTNSNALIVTGPAENMPVIGALIDTLDQLPDVETRIKVFSVINNDAGVLLQLLTDLFSTQQQGNQGGVSSIPVQTASAGGDSTLVGLRFSADPRTNSIIASGSDSNLRVVEDLLYRLDQEDLHERIVKVFRLRNTLSDNVEAAVQDWIGQRANLYGDGGDAVGVPFSREIIIVSEPEGNSLIVSATPEYFGEIERIIIDLDRRPMFMIHTLIAEVDLGAVREFGFEWGIQDSIVFNRGLGVVPNAVNTAIDNPFNVAGVGTSALPFLNENLAGGAISDIGLSRTNSALGYGGLVMSAGNESVNLLLRALKADNRIQILSSPTIMTLDNLQGYVQVGEQVRYLTESTIINGAVQNTTEPVDTGIILQVRPRLSPDGMIVMEVDATNSSLGNEADGTVIAVSQNGDPIRVPPINITTAQTTIMARHGQTTVFAGLITTIDDRETRGVPILADIPAVGRLFRFDSETQLRSELLIILTPYIVNDEADVAAINQVAMDRMHWCLSDVADVYGPIGYDDGQVMFQHEPDVIYPDLDPTGSNPQSGELPTPGPVVPPAPSVIDPANSGAGANMLRGPALGTGVNGAQPSPSDRRNATPLSPVGSSSRNVRPRMSDLAVRPATALDNGQRAGTAGNAAYPPNMDARRYSERPYGGAFPGASSATQPATGASQAGGERPVYTSGGYGQQPTTPRFR